ncbi:MAG TPA: hypothetical protein DDW49_08405 [Deltaproteobacteria bacterium]|nr:MAG: hypothetical protein A2048_08020 [Deltaproteobacteria bacterium GWA2_45_12]HBF13386.1 hypothetical protein [Deltaproteobacteria bacterium]
MQQSPYRALSESFWFPCLLAFLLRTPSFFVNHYNVDEITNFIFSKFILDGRLSSQWLLGNTYYLTYGFYIVISRIFGSYNLVALHMAHAVWVSLTTFFIYWAGRELNQKNKGGFWAATFYAVFSVAFLSKDFHAALAESLSLLPAAMSLFCFLRAMRTKEKAAFVLAGFCVGLSALFKAPSGIMVLPMILVALVIEGSWLVIISCIACGLILALAFPFAFIEDPVAGFFMAIKNITNVKEGYIRAYDNIGFAYLFAKLALRSFLLALAAFPLWFMAFGAVRKFFLKKAEIIYLVMTFLCLFVVTTLGKRVFFHYFVFLLPTLALLASVSMISKLKEGVPNLLLKGFALYTFISVAGFSADGLFQFSLKNEISQKVIDEVIQTTKPSDRIYVWGLAPQIYFYSKREAASTQIWADKLAGFSPGSPAMEYMRATGKTLTLPDSIIQDLRLGDHQGELRQAPKALAHSLNEKELLTIAEILDSISPENWKKLISDFFVRPPVLFLDTSGANHRNFGTYPVSRYELLQKFLYDNHYVRRKTVEGIDFYYLSPSALDRKP